MLKFEISTKKKYSFSNVGKFRDKTTKRTAHQVLVKYRIFFCSSIIIRLTLSLELVRIGIGQMAGRRGEQGIELKNNLKISSIGPRGMWVTNNRLNFIFRSHCIMTKCQSNLK